ncbi:hypothetical protein HQ576_09890, partial [bacterium]|nr:hypothetical protein [bacterium]
HPIPPAATPKEGSTLADKPDELNAEPLTKEEIARLTHWAKVALAVRCAVRCMPALTYFNELPLRADVLREHCITIETGVTLAMLSATRAHCHSQAEAMADEVFGVNEHVDATGKSANAQTAGLATVAAADTIVAAEYVGDTDPRASSSSFAARSIEMSLIACLRLFAASGVSHEEAMRLSVRAMRADRQALLAEQESSSGPAGAPIAREFFERPIWSEDTALKHLSTVLQLWQGTLAGMDLQAIYEHYQAMILGTGIDWEDAERRVEEWATTHAGKEGKQRSSVTLGLGVKFGAEAGVKAALDAEALQAADRALAPPGPGGVVTVKDDEPAMEDKLGREDLTEVLAATFAKSENIRGYTFALLGDWGAGKTTIMGLIRDRLNEAYPGVFDFAWFNAWEYEHTDNIAAGLAQQVVGGLVSGFKGFRGFFARQWLRLRFLWREHRSSVPRLLLYLIVAVLPLAALYLGAPLVGLDQKKVEAVQDLVGVGAIGAAALIAVYLFKTTKHIFEHPLATKLGTYLKLPSYGKHLGMVPVLKRHIETLCELRLGDARRLIVFVDDLDRCQPECIAKTLDAIRLVMDRENVFVFIGIDHRIAFKAIERHYKELADGEGGRDASDVARDYLGKIIQLPIRLLPADDDELKEFVNDQLFPDAIELPSPAEGETTSDSGLTDVEDEVVEDEAVEPAPEGGPAEPPPLPPYTGSTPEAEKVDSGAESAAADRREIEETADRMRETTKERDAFYQMATTFGFSNPRQLLRLRNSYRVLKGLDWKRRGVAEEVEPSEYDPKWLATLLFWEEFLATLPREAKHDCIAVLWGKAKLETIESESVREIVKDVRDDIRGIFDKEDDYAALTRFVRTVV